MAVLSAVEPIAIGKNTYACSVCREPGHRRPTCPWRPRDPVVSDEDAEAERDSNDMLTASMVLELDRINDEIEALEERRDRLALGIARRRGIR